MITTEEIEEQCADLGDKIRRKVEEFYRPRVSALDEEIKKKQAAGIDPSNVPYMDGAVHINLIKLLEQIRAAKWTALESAKTQEIKCVKESVPNWIGDTQKATETILMLAALPFVMLTKDYADVHIDLGEVYKGYPLGGDNALIPKARTDVLDTLQIGGDVRSFIENPNFF